MKKSLIVILILVFGVQSLGAEFWVVTPKISSRAKLDEIAEKYRSEIKDGDFSTSFDNLLGHPASPEEMSVILDLDSLARAAALNGFFKKASDYYLKLREKLKTLPNVWG